MFCPKCGNLMETQNRSALCSTGEMSLSEHLTERLQDCFIKKNSLPKELEFSFRVGGNWFCPGCGVPMRETNGVVRCPQCELSLNEFIFELIERSPHWRANNYY